MKVLNLFAGLGGNRKLWDNVEVTAVEYNALIAELYKQNYPQDRVIIGDARTYLTHHYKEFEFIWGSPECQTHSRTRYMKSKIGVYPPKLPDFSLYSLIVFLSNFYNGKWAIENVEPYYEPFIKPTAQLGRHFIWSNFPIPPRKFNKPKIGINDVTSSTIRHGFSIPKETKVRKDHFIRSCVDPKIGLYVLHCAIEKAPKLELFSKSFQFSISEKISFEGK